MYRRNDTAPDVQLQESPAYAVLNSQVSPGYTEPPKLPPSRVPYYEEIESDARGTTKEISASPQEEGVMLI